MPDKNPPPVPPRTVLVVEDHADSRAALRALLELWGYEVEEAADGLEGVQRALASGPDAVLCDIGMPRLDGYGLARRVRGALGGGVLLIALTAYNDRERALGAGFDEHVLKPAEPEHLRRLLQAGSAAGCPAPAPG